MRELRWGRAGAVPCTGSPGPVLALRPQVPPEAVSAVRSLRGPAVLPLQLCQQTPAGLAVRLRRAELFQRLLGPLPGPAPPPRAGWVLLHCPALRGPAALRPRHLRSVLLAEHLAQLLRSQG